MSGPTDWILRYIKTTFTFFNYIYDRIGIVWAVFRVIVQGVVIHAMSFLALLIFAYDVLTRHEVWTDISEYKEHYIVFIDYITTVLQYVCDPHCCGNKFTYTVPIFILI